VDNDFFHVTYRTCKVIRGDSIEIFSGYDILIKEKRIGRAIQQFRISDGKGKELTVFSFEIQEVCFKSVFDMEFILFSIQN